MQVLPVITVVNLVQNPTVTYLKLFGDRLIRNVTLAQANKSLKDAYEKLKFHDAMEQEFINLVCYLVKDTGPSHQSDIQKCSSYPDKREQYDEVISTKR